MSSALPWARYWRGIPRTRVAGHGQARRLRWARHGVEQEGAGTAVADAVLRGDHQSVACRVVEHGGVGWRDHPHVPDGGVDPLVGQLVGGVEAGSDRLAHPE